MRTLGLLSAMAGLAVAAEMRPIIPETPKVPRDESYDLNQPPRRLSVDPNSEFYHPCVTRVGVKFEGKHRRGDVRQYDVEQGWIEIYRRDRRGRLITSGDEFSTMTLHGTVEPYWKGQKEDPRQAESIKEIGSEERLRLAQEKRARKAAKLAKQMRG